MKVILCTHSLHLIEKNGFEILEFQQTKQHKSIDIKIQLQATAERYAYLFESLAQQNVSFECKTVSGTYEEKINQWHINLSGTLFPILNP